MQNNPDNSELWISRLLDGELTEDEQLQVNRALLREPDMMRLRDDYQKIDSLAASALDSLRSGTVDVDAVFAAAPPQTQRVVVRGRRGWILIPGAIAAALLAMVVPGPAYRPSTPIVTDGSALYSPNGGSYWGGGSELATPVSALPRIRSQTGRDVIGAMDESGNLYWIEVEKKRTERWPAGVVVPPDSKDSM